MWGSFLLLFVLFMVFYLWQPLEGNVPAKENYNHAHAHAVWEDPPRFVPNRVIGKPQKMPYRISQTNGDRILPEMAKAIKSWIALNPEYSYHYYTTEECREFIKNNFESRILKAYDTLIPGAYKADLWRYCVLYVNGGIYADSAMVCLEPINTYLGSEDEFLVPIDGGYSGGLYNAFIGCTPQHSLIGGVIKEVVRRIEAREYGHRDLYPTGPIALGDTLNKIRGNPPGTRFIPGVKNNIRIITRCSIGQATGMVYDLKANAVINTKYEGHIQEKKLWSRLPNYAILWKEKKIYAS